MDYYWVKEFINDGCKTIFGKFVGLDIVLGKYRFMDKETLINKCNEFAQKDHVKQFYLASIALIEKVSDGLADSFNSLEKEINDLRIENERLKKENEEMRLHIMASPGGSIYFEAENDFNNNCHDMDH